MLGLTNGSAGETCAVLILAGGLYLAARRMLNWRIPAAILATVAGLSWGFHLLAPADYPPAGFMLFSGGLMLGAVFMATDMVASPITHAGCVVYGVLIGVLVTVIALRTAWCTPNAAGPARPVRDFGGQGCPRPAGL